MPSTKFYELIENAVGTVSETANLFEWSENYEFPSPASLFLDIIGYSEDEHGERLCQDKFPLIGYLEAGYLADALQEWSLRPHEVRDFVDELMNNYTEEAN